MTKCLTWQTVGEQFVITCCFSLPFPTSEDNVNTQAFRFAKNIMKSKIRTYIFLITFFCLPFLPADPSDLCNFLELRALTSNYGHLKNILLLVKYLDKAYGHSFPSDDFSLYTTLQGLKRHLARTPLFVMPLTPSILCLLYTFLDM